MFASTLVPALEKCMIDTGVDSLARLPEEMSVLEGERFSFQVAYRGVGEDAWLVAKDRWRIIGSIKVEGIPEENYTLRRVRHVPSLMPSYRKPRVDVDYISTVPGFFPDLLDTPREIERVSFVYEQTNAYWIEIEGLKPGSYECTVTLALLDEIHTHTLKLRVLEAKLPEQEMILTQWFHTDCLSSYYDCEVFSERYWKITENFARVAVRNGINMLLTPIFTPPLDTAIGGERHTVQLVDVSLDNGKYSFGFDNLDRWIDMCNRCGVKYLEISHLFTQWGAGHAPKVMAKVNGEEKKIFGWETDASEGEYPEFLSEFLPAFLDHMKARGDDKRCYFHISDEPNMNHIEQYMKSKRVVEKYLKGYPIMDALSNYEFFEQGLLDMPIPASNHIKPFIDNKVENLWTYYCCGQNVNVSNRFFAMTGARTRAICAAFYKYDIVGFLQWGFNFYYDQGSHEICNPYLDTTGDYFVMSGDTFSVYPSPDGKALESIRISCFYDALQDVRAMKLLESLTDKETVMQILESVLGKISFDISNYPVSKMLEMRKAINDKISELI